MFKGRDFGSFKFLTGDVNFVDHGGKWCRKVGERRYHVIELMCWEDYDSSAVADYGRYNVSLSEVDLVEIGNDGIALALKSCGWELDADGNVWCPYSGDIIAKHDSSHRDLVLVEACHGYGSKAPLSDASGNNYRLLLREARRESLELTKDKAAWEDALDRPVNAICTSARDYMKGNLFSRS